MKSILKILCSWPLMIVVALLLVVLAYETSIKRPVHVYVSEHYHGWIRLEYDVEDAPKLSLNWLYPILNLEGCVPDSGVLKTSSVRPVADDMIHGRVSSQSITRPDGSHFEREFEVMFIGPDEDYQKHRTELERYKKGENEFIIPSLEALPRVRNIKY